MLPGDQTTRHNPLYLWKRRFRSAPDQKIIGIVLVGTGGGAGTWQRIDSSYAAFTPPAGWFDDHLTFSGVADQTIDGQAMVKIPAFWSKWGTVPSGAYAGKPYWMIADQAADGFDRHPAFIAAGMPIDQFWLGKYQASVSGGKLCSVAGVSPAVSISYNSFISYASARNVGGVSGFAMWDIHQLSALKLLFLARYGVSDSQSAIANGRVSAASVVAVDAADVAQATFCGVVGLWGNIDQIIDGLKTDSSTKYQIFDTVGGRTYKTSSSASPGTAGYLVTLISENGADYESRHAFLPLTINTTASAATIPDYFYRASSRRGVVGGYYARGAQAGLFYIDLSNVTDTSTSGVRGTRLAKT